ncbi:hypothetical protein J6590_032166 [Homalodisca vitripennis]|nr:hypothetical protein J6590_032166 [Homalodisca vitripennis]
MGNEWLTALGLLSVHYGKNQFLQSKDRTVLLEGSVVEAQQLEGQIVLFLDWLSDVEAQLISRLDNDLTAHDLPDDVQRLVEEFETQARTLQEMEEQVRSYKAAGKHEAAARLHEQMILLQELLWTQIDDIFPRLEYQPIVTGTGSRPVRAQYFSGFESKRHWHLRIIVCTLVTLPLQTLYLFTDVDTERFVYFMCKAIAFCTTTGECYSELCAESMNPWEDQPFMFNFNYRIEVGTVCRENVE